MTHEWRPSVLGRLLTGNAKWTLKLEGEAFELRVRENVYRYESGGPDGPQVDEGWFWSTLTLGPGVESVGGLPNDQAKDLTATLEAAWVTRTIRAMQAWLEEVSEKVEEAKRERRWISRDEQDDLNRGRPQVKAGKVRALLRDPMVKAKLAVGLETANDVLARWDVAGSRAYWVDLNEEHTRRELVDCKDFFERIEVNPLTQEQARAVICFDNRVQVIASAGSGKTSTMIGKAAYAIHRGFVQPERIVLLAFNRRAAEELKERAAKAFERLGITDVSIEATTFHALGLSIVGRATGKKPHVPDWASDPVAQTNKLTEIIERLKSQSMLFRSKWALYRFLFGAQRASFGEADELRALQGERVKSQEELIIANWLFHNGVPYEYERRYPYDTATETHGQYHPDFYYSSLDLYHEHLALDSDGRAPEEFKGYLSGVRWKRMLHREMGTELIETTSAMMREGRLFEFLGEQLEGRGLRLDPDEQRKTGSDNLVPLSDKDLCRLIQTFMRHVKSNCLSVEEMRRQKDGIQDAVLRLRCSIFLDLFEPVLREWDDALREEGATDFEDMINLAAEHLEKGCFVSPYDLVMVDEFQDASRARARLIRALVEGKGRYLFAVGDDWQSINRFAGADISVMTDFEGWFGEGQTLRLERTFRCPQELCDIASSFVMKNPAQLRKRVHSQTPKVGPVLHALQVENREKVAMAVEAVIEAIARDLRMGTIPPGRNGKVSVAILGRYNFEREHVPSLSGNLPRYVELHFLTVHRSKGSEFDYVILPSMNNPPRSLGFPSTRVDDPVLQLAMPECDAYKYAEERRLFYVALTRARRSVTMLCVRGQVSVFVEELVRDGVLRLTDESGKPVPMERCPGCKVGMLVKRTGPYGEFIGCARFPNCRYTRNIERTSGEWSL